MITYIDSSNKQDYTVLFNKASAKLGLIPIVKEVIDANGDISYEYFKRVQNDGQWSEVPCAADEIDVDGNLLIDDGNGGKIASKGISSLNEYFQHIRELASLAIGNGRTGSDPYFLRLPLDEPFFEINANTRAISVPSALRQIGVIGDKYAEVVFFKIDRYYDAIDLDTRQIYIEWEDAAGNKGVSRDFLRDTQSEKDKIIFGWVIGDELTKAIGTIRFAVRFVEWNHDAGADEDKAVSGTELAYSFSSLPAQITIVDSLHYDLFEDSEQAKMIKTDDQAATILFYLENSNPDSTDETAPELADIPEFVRNLSGSLVKEGLYEADLNDEGKLELLVEAISPDSGNISYMFGKKAAEDGGTSGIVAQIKYIEVEIPKGHDFSDDDAVYYIKKANDTFEIVAHSAIEDELNEIAAGESLKYYEKVAFIVVAGPGYYFANARNTVSGKKTSSANSNMVYVPFAAEAVVDAQMPEKFVISEVAYELAKDEDIDQTSRADADKSNIKIVAGEAGAASITLGAGLLGPKFSAVKTKGLTYTWYKSDDIFDAEMADAAVIAGETGATLEVTEPGYYAVAVDNFYNNDHTAIDKMAAGAIRVTRMPVVPTVNWDKWTSVLSAGNTDALIEVEEVDHDHITYEWHKITADNSDMDPVATADMAQASGELVFANGIAGIPFKPLAQGDYYFILKNELNGASVIMSSALNPNMGVIAVRAGTGYVEPTNPSDEEPENPDEEVIYDGGEQQ